MRALFLTIPHSGEQISDKTPWLRELPESVLMCDVDRYVNWLYEPAIKCLGLPAIVAEWHRYVVDLNRVPEDVDQDSVVDALSPSGAFTTGFHWVKTTRGDRVLPKPLSRMVHDDLVREFYEPFHHAVREMYSRFQSQGAREVYHLDLHSMPSKGTAAHRDPGRERPEIVISDNDGKSAALGFRELVVGAYQEAGFEVSLNWPYKGGRITQLYGQPLKGQNVLQIEMRRNLYMDEESKKRLEEPAARVRERLTRALATVSMQLESLNL